MFGRVANMPLLASDNTNYLRTKDTKDTKVVFITRVFLDFSFAQALQFCSCQLKHGKFLKCTLTFDRSDPCMCGEQMLNGIW